MPTSGPRKSLLRDQRGQLLIMWMIFMLPMTLLCFGVFNVGMMVGDKMKVQNAADNAAYSAATWNARYLNQTAYINRAMVANYDTIATLTGIWSFVDATDGFIALIRTLLRVFFNIGQAITPVAQALHQVNNVMSQVIGSGTKQAQFRVGYALEAYNLALSYAQQGLYIANQVGRGRVAQTIAWGVDRRIQYFAGSEVWGIQEMGNRRDWKESDEENGLRRTVEYSLNNLSNGGSFRDTSNFPVLGTVLGIINAVPCFYLHIGPHGYDGPKFNHVTGQNQQGGENMPAKMIVGSGKKMQVVQKDKIYQLDHNGIEVGFDCIISFTLISFGHFSDDDYNLPNAIQLDFPHIADEEGDHGQDFIARNVDCQSFGGGAPSLDSDPQFNQLNQENQLCGNSQDPCKFVDPSNNNPSDLPPGPACPCPVTFGTCSCEPQCPTVTPEERRISTNQARANENPPRSPIPASVLSDDKSCKSIQEDLNDAQEEMQENMAQNYTASSKPCATIYEYSTPIAEMKVTHYIQRQESPDGMRVEGPSVFVYTRMRAGLLPLFRTRLLGLGDPNDPNVEAYAFGRAYYTQRPGNASVDKESAFNPFWAGRLEKAPILLH